MIRLVLVLIAAVSLTVSFAFADSKTLDDPKDAPGRVDIAEVTAKHGKKKSRLVHKIVGYARIKDGEEPGVNVYAGKWDRVGASYQVSAFGVTNGMGERTGNVKMKRPDPKTVVYKFGKGAIGKPGKYKWQACVCIEGDQQDLAPDSPATHKLD